MEAFLKISVLCVLWAGVKSQECGGYYWGASGEFVSPGFPDSYSKLQDCTYRVEPGGMTELSIDFDVEEGGYSCDYDYIEVYDEYNVQLETLCKYGSRVYFGNAFRIEFHSDFSVVRGGFIVHWRKVCGGDRWEANGNVTSPGHPYYYDNDLFCEWYIDPWTPIKLDISYDLEGDGESCPYDRIEVFNGRYRLIDTLCGYGNVTYYGYMFILIFSTDGSVTYPGFEATWEEYDGEFTTMPTTPWTSPWWWNENATTSYPWWWGSSSTWSSLWGNSSSTSSPWWWSSSTTSNPWVVDK